MRKLMKPSKHKFDEFTHLIPSSVIERILGKRESKRFWKFMAGQTVMGLEAQSGIYAGDLQRYLKGDWTLYD